MIAGGAGTAWEVSRGSAEEEKRGGVPGVRVWRFSVGCSGGCPVATCHWKRMDACVASASGGRWAEVGFLALSRLTPDLPPDVGGPADPIAPTIIIPPKNTSVVAGTSEVTMECVANARWAVPLPTPPHSPSLPTQGLLEETCRNSERPWGVLRGPSKGDRVFSPKEGQRAAVQSAAVAGRRIQAGRSFSAGREERSGSGGS